MFHRGKRRVFFLLFLGLFHCEVQSFSFLSMLRVKNLVFAGVTGVCLGNIGIWGFKTFYGQSFRRIFSSFGLGGDDSDSSKFQSVDTESLRFGDVVGMDSVLVEARDIVSFLHDPQRYARVGARRPRGLLLYGPPGCGKTLLARAIAGEAGYSAVYASGAEFVNTYVGTGPAAVRALFDSVSGSSAIIFIDEIDSFGKRGGADSSGARIEYDNTTNELLRQIDEIAKSDLNIFIIGATNSIEKIDPALLRSGRFDYKIEVPLPNTKSREAIFQHFLNRVEHFSLDNPVIQCFASRMVGFSGADIELMVNEAAILAGREGAACVAEEHLEGALDRMLFGIKCNNDAQVCPVNGASGMIPPTERISYNEAGRALFAVLHGMELSKISILNRNVYGEILPLGSVLHTRSALLDRAAYFYAGFVAEELVFGEASVYSRDDLLKGAKIINRIVRDCGLCCNDLRGVPQRAVCSQDYAVLFDQEIVSLTHEVRDRAKDILVENEDLLHGLASFLLERKSLRGDEIYDYLDRLGDM